MVPSTHTRKRGTRWWVRRRARERARRALTLIALGGVVGCAAEDERACQAVTLDPSIVMSEPYAVTCTGATEDTTPCDGEVFQERIWAADGRSELVFETRHGFYGWHVHVRIWPDGCVRVDQQPFSDLLGPDPPEPVPATRANTTLSTIPESITELRFLGGRTHAVFEDDGIVMDIEF